MTESTKFPSEHWIWLRLLPTFEDNYTIVLDNEITNVTGITDVKVTAQIIGLENKKFNVTNITTINGPSDGRLQS